jgi:hypothetical protein
MVAMLLEHRLASFDLNYFHNQRFHLANLALRVVYMSHGSSIVHNCT